MDNQEPEGKAVRHPVLIVDVVGMQQYEDDSILVVLRDQQGVQVSLKLEDSAAYTLISRLKEVLRNA